MDTSLADIAAVTRNDGDGMFGCGGGMWIFALLILAMLGNGGLFGGNRMGDRNATVGDVQRATDFAALERQNNETVASVRQGVYDTTSAIKDGNYNILSELRDIQAATAAGFANQQKCCCETLRAIDGVNYNGAINTASINANTTAAMQKILDALTCNRMADMQQQINALQLRDAMAGVVRYPMSTAYNAGANPFCNSGCCGNYGNM